MSLHIRTTATMFSSLRTSARKAVAAAPSAGNKLRNRPGAAGSIEQTACRALATVPGPRLFDYETVTSVLKQSDAVEAVEAAFGMLAKGKVDVPLPMHIGIDESANAGPGDCHIKGGYISGTSTWTVKLANVSFYKNIEKVGRPWLALPSPWPSVTSFDCLAAKEGGVLFVEKLGAHSAHTREHLRFAILRLNAQEESCCWSRLLRSAKMRHSGLVRSSARDVSSSCSRVA